jgi:hypothetical protein
MDLFFSVGMMIQSDYIWSFSIATLNYQRVIKLKPQAEPPLRHLSGFGKNCSGPGEIIHESNESHFLRTT